MKKFKLILAMLLISVVGLQTVNAQKKEKKKSSTEEVLFNVSLSCKNCQNKIEKNLPWEKGVKDLTVDLEKKQVSVKYDKSRTDDTKLKEAIEKLDFTCEKVEPKSDATK